MKKLKNWICFEGIDGSGKTSQVEKLKKYLEENGKKVEVYRSPGTTKFGEKVREIFKNPDLEISPEARFYLICSDRNQLLEEKILKHLNSGGIVISDRWLYSTIAYQGFGQNFSVEKILKTHEEGILSNIPEKTFYLEVPLEISKKRSFERNEGKKDFFDFKEDDFFKNLIKGYDFCFEKFPEEFIKIDGTKNIDEVFEEIKKNLSFVK